MTITLKQLDYFIATAESGQVSHAAVELNISQSAVTAAIKTLEADLGVRLLERNHAGVRLTMEGARFLEHARVITGASVFSSALSAKPWLLGPKLAPANPERLINFKALNTPVWLALAISWSPGSTALSRL